jgi:hypothetical protein
MLTVREFVRQSYRLIDASNPTIPMHGDDLSLGIRVLNQLLQGYASTGLMITIAKTVSVGVSLGVKEVLFTDPNYLGPTTAQTETVTLVTASPIFMVADGLIYSVGDRVTGNGISDLTSIIDITGNQITLSSNATINGNSTLTFYHEIFDPTVAYIRQGRLANLNSAWLLLNGVTYPLINESRNEFLAAWKYDPLQSLPRFIVVFPETDIVRARLYPAPSQFYTFFCRGKFQLQELTSNDDMSLVPQYYHRYCMFALARDVAMYKGRAEAWTEKLEMLYKQALDDMVASSEVNLAITGERDSLLNGAYAVKAGVY